MQRTLLVCILATLLFGCGGAGAGGDGGFPYQPIPGVPQAVNDLGSLIVSQERSVVKPGGDQNDPGYSSDDQQKFDNSNRLQQIIQSVTGNKTFTDGVAAIRTLSPDQQTAVFNAYETPIYPTWATEGQIGKGTTDAGYAVELEIANALTSAAKTAL